MTEKGFITFRNVQEDDVALNMSIESLNERVFSLFRSKICIFELEKVAYH